MKLFSALSVLILVGSGILARDRFTWVLEVAPILIVFPLLLATSGRFRFTSLLYVLILVHFCVLALGGIYTYAEVPLGYWMESWFGFTRNNYDRIGHFFQGFVPALALRELLLRTSPLRPGKWLTFLVIGFCLGVSASYEIIEWWTAASQGASADAFLGTQGDIWDSQSDMFMALIGATVAMLGMSKVHDRFLAKL